MTEDQLANAVMRFDADAFERADARRKSAPLDLSEADYAQLAIVSPVLEAEAREAQRQAQLAIVAASPAGPLVTKAAEAAEPADFAGFVSKHGAQLVTVAFLGETVNAIADVMTALRDRVATLEQTNKEMQARTLELEAAQAARSEVMP